MQLQNKEEKNKGDQEEFNDPLWLDKNQVTIDEWIKTLEKYEE